ncbi:hypothetical protein ACA910_017742 [Epithemia clementina (nom. ined.)]
MILFHPKSTIQKFSSFRFDHPHILRKLRHGCGEARRTATASASLSKAGPRDENIEGSRHLKNNKSTKSGSPESLCKPADFNCLRLFNSLTRNVEPLPVASDGKKSLAWYTCGPTVYAPAHLGHARTYVWLDILRRVLEHQYHHLNISTEDRDATVPPPLFVLNITDVDDKILAAAAAGPESALDLARRFEAEFFKEWDTLNCLRPHVVTRVTEHVESAIVPYIQQIGDQAGGTLTYMLESDGLYFNVRAFEDVAQIRRSRYGKLAPSAQAVDLFDNHPQHSTTTNDETGTSDSQDENVVEARKVTQKKKDPRDFCLWKLRKDGETMYWSSPWGDGRPGWHIECSAMIEAVQNQFRDQYTFTVHAGGVDLKFPHHTNEIAQAEAYHLSKQALIQQSLNKNNEAQEKHPGEWIPHWVHTGHLHIEGMKMSKSLKNFIPISKLLSQDKENAEGGVGAWSCPADDFRLWCFMSGSYRGTATYSSTGIAEARRMRIEKICKLLDEGHEWIRYRGASRGTESDITRADNDVKITQNVRKIWNQADVELFAAANHCRVKCLSALYSDLDGTTFVKELAHLVDEGLGYLRNVQPSFPDEPLRHVLQTVRHLLQVVGFSNVTCHAGLEHWDTDNPSTGGKVVGGERALINEIVRFRKAVRDVTLATQGEDDFRLMKQEILRLCDETRESTLPALGVQLYDGKHAATTDERNITNSVCNQVPSSLETASSPWSYCIPVPILKTENSDEAQPETAILPRNPQRLDEISIQEFFRVGRYEGMFSAYTSDGFPTHNAEGTELSKSLTKKLLKKRQAHEKRLAEELKEGKT